MRLNEATVLVGERVVLTPYRLLSTGSREPLLMRNRREHVQRYHEWMSDPAIRDATASEELSLDEEYEMQRSWQVDDDKLTFIVHQRDPSVDPSCPNLYSSHSPSRMIGDVNIFLSEYCSSDDEDQDEDQDDKYDRNGKRVPSVPRKRAEVELMIAEQAARNQGLGSSALRIFLAYSSKELSLPPSSFFVRVGMDNVPSLRLFEKLGFKRKKVVEAFREVEMVWGANLNEGSTSTSSSWGWEERWETVTISPDDNV